MLKEKYLFFSESFLNSLSVTSQKKVSQRRGVKWYQLNIYVLLPLQIRYFTHHSVKYFWNDSVQSFDVLR